MAVRSKCTENDMGMERNIRTRHRNPLNRFINNGSTDRTIPTRSGGDIWGSETKFDCPSKYAIKVLTVSYKSSM